MFSADKGVKQSQSNVQRQVNRIRIANVFDLLQVAIAEGREDEVNHLLLRMKRLTSEVK